MSKSLHYKAATLENFSCQLSENIAQEKCVFRSIYVVNAQPSFDEFLLQTNKSLHSKIGRNIFINASKNTLISCLIF